MICFTNSTKLTDSQQSRASSSSASGRKFSTRVSPPSLILDQLLQCKSFTISSLITNENSVFGSHLFHLCVLFKCSHIKASPPSLLFSCFLDAQVYLLSQALLVNRSISVCKAHLSSSNVSLSSFHAPPHMFAKKLVFIIY